MKAFRPALARAAASPLWVLALTVLVDAALLIVNRTVYAGVISMMVPQLLVMLSACWCIFTLRLDLKSRGSRMLRVLLPLVLSAAAAVVFVCARSAYSVARATQTAERTGVSVRAVHVMDMTPGGFFVKKGYVLTGADTTGEVSVFFDPQTGENWRMRG